MEGSTQAPIRHPIPWRDEDFWDQLSLDKELRRVFDICHGCRRCFNLCDSFPQLFDVIDESESGELDTVSSDTFPKIAESCTLCDMCFLTKCPYVPPHEFNIDFPHLMLRARAVETEKIGKPPFIQNQLAQTDRNGIIGKKFGFILNFFTNINNKIFRKILNYIAGIDFKVILPKFNKKKFEIPLINKEGKANKRKAVIYTSCFANYNRPEIAEASLAVLAAQGVEIKLHYPECCGMPMLEQGNIERVSVSAEKISESFISFIEDGFDVIALTSSCALMMKYEWPLILPENESVKLLSQNTYDIDEYLVDISKKEGLVDGMKPVDGGISLHLACHSRAQNMGAKSNELLKLIPEADISIVERCSGHGGTFGVLTPTHDLARKVGKPAARMVAKADPSYVISSCPLASKHLSQITKEDVIKDKKSKSIRSGHPIELMAVSYGFLKKDEMSE
ncbi:MAG: glycerol-3-phosphate dehydrogenase [Rhizobiales bacterium TMED168]|nr:MAG: glycerol-3-phosphate dehydrogenase [Rhizobiales bacterium TMED168]|tara:strand:+ start:71434 stop:72783 length:1350 start_codon:yes stop_codon:yes gene_type:complete